MEWGIFILERSMTVIHSNSHALTNFPDKSPSLETSKFPLYLEIQYWSRILDLT